MGKSFDLLLTLSTLESKIPKGAPAVAGDGGKGEEGDWDAAGMRR